MPNPIEAAHELKNLLIAVRDSVSMAQKPLNTILSSLSKTEEIIASLEEIHNNYVPLEIKSNDSDLSKNLTCWRHAPSGNLKAGTSEYKEITDNSKTLKALHAAGIDIPIITKFSDDEIKLAKELGDGFGEFHNLLQQVNGCINHNHNSHKHGTVFSKVSSSLVDERFFNLLKSYNIIDDYETFMYVHKKGDYIESDFRKISKAFAKNNSTKIIFSFSKSNYHHLISGHWFNAYAYYIIDDHLNRNSFDYELYTRVSYTAPAEIFRSGGDFDILSMVGRKILLVECKSSELRGDKDNFLKIIQKTEGIKKVFDLTHTNYYQYVFLLIYNHFSNNQQEILDELEGTGIKPVRPDEIRGTVIELFRKEM